MKEVTVTTADGKEFRDGITVSGPFEAFCQPGFFADLKRATDKRVPCGFCGSQYNPNNLTRKRRHENALCK